jgi:hypothetical protein
LFVQIRCCLPRNHPSFINKNINIINIYKLLFED